MSIKKNFIYNFLFTGSNLLLPLITFPYLSRVLGAEGIGICNFILSYSKNFIIIAALGLPVYGVREIARAGNDAIRRSQLFFELLIIHLVFSGFLLIIYYSSIFIISDFQDYKQLSLLGGMFILLNVFSIEWLFSGLSDFKYITFRSLIVRALSIISIFIFVKEKADFNIYFLITLLTIFLTVIININYARKYISKKVIVTFKGTLLHFKPVFLLGIYMVLTSIYLVLPITLLGFFSSKAAVGYYYSADKIIRMIVSIFTALTTVMIPKLNNIIEQKGSSEYILLVQKLLTIVITLGIPLSFFVYLVAEPMIMLLAGKDFSNSIFCIQVLSPVILIVALAQIFVILILSVNRRDKEMVILSTIGVSISLIINVTLIPYFAEKATAYSQLSAEFFVTVISFFLARRYLNFNFPVRKFVLNILLVIPFALITYLSMKLSDSIFFQLIFSGIVCAMYFLFYQLVLIKDEFVGKLVAPYFKI